MNVLEMYEAGLIKIDPEALVQLRADQAEFEALKAARLAEVSDALRSGYLTDDILAAIDAYACLFSSTERSDVLLDLVDRYALARPQLVWRAIHRHWNGFDFIPHAKFARLFKRIREHWSADYLSEA